ncbi:hypothetical protein HPP92_019125 [Vanilla planifolia]|uniref:ESF1 RRM domain-containing protein n=1 Tax=Vanilla planifolia TaxID=51239 RepID=A0A835UP16_VANPL|nr:hypothetical protein HPP92_019125 [Vanilla planifolia]
MGYLKSHKSLIIATLGTLVYLVHHLLETSTRFDDGWVDTYNDSLVDIKDVTTLMPFHLYDIEALIWYLKYSVNSDLCQYLMADHKDTPVTELETHRLAVVNMDWDHIKAVDLYVVMSSCLPKGGQVLSVSIYPSEFGLKCMDIEAVRGPTCLLADDEKHSDDEPDPEVINEKLRAYELNKLRYYFAVAVFDSSATANYVYNTLDGTELTRTSNVFDLRFIADTMEFRHPPRDATTEAPTAYKEPDFHTLALQHSKVKLTWEADEPQRLKTLRRKFNADKVCDTFIIL